MLPSQMKGSRLIKPIKNLTKRKATGGKRKAYRGSRAYEKSRYAMESVKGENKIVKKNVRGGGFKKGLKSAEYANVLDPSTKESEKIMILKIIKNPANRDYERRGVITKGCTIETEKGKAKVSSRPGQDGVINAILIK